MTDAGLIVLCSFISPFRAERQLVRDTAAAGEFIEIFVDTPLETAIARDPKGLYKQGRSPARSRISPASTSPTSGRKAPSLCSARPKPSVEEHADPVIAELEKRGMIARL